MMRDPNDRTDTPVAPNSGEEDERLTTPAGDGPMPLDGPMPRGAQPDPHPDASPPESPVWPVPRHDPA